MHKEIIVLNRDVFATLIPSGSPIKVSRGTEVTIVQSLGDTFTVNIFGNLARVEARDADALGKEAKNPLEALPENATIVDKIWAQLRTVYDPEIPVNIADLGLVYHCDVEKLKDGTHRVVVEMTLTAPGCGMGPAIMGDVKRKVLLIPDVSDADVEMVFDPPWDREMMSEAAKLQLGLL